MPALATTGVTRLMKQGHGKGYNAGCCDGLEVWGMSSNAPNFPQDNSNYERPWTSYDIAHPLRDIDLTGHYSFEIRPELWSRGVNQSWGLYAAQVPGTHPGPNGDNANKPISSRANGSWFVEIAELGRHTKFDDADEEADKTHALTHVKTCRGSRAIYVDGQQSYLVYRVSAQPAEINVTTWRQYNDVEQWNTDIPPSMGDHHVVNIASQELEDSYPIQYLGGITDPTTGLTGTAMEEAFSSLHYTSRSTFAAMHWNIMNVISGDVKTPYNWGCNNMSFGRKYYVQSSYYPGVGRGFNKPKWSVARIEYDTLDVFCTKAVFAGISNTTEFVGDPEADYRGNYWIVLPSVRAYLDSSAPSPDEPWVCAIHKDPEAAKRIVTGRWLSKVYETAGTNPATNYADGTLATGEIEHVILDTSDSALTSLYPDETWNNIQIRAYNRVYDPATGHSRDLLLFTTQDDADGFHSLENVTADFEQPGTYDAQFLSHMRYGYGSDTGSLEDIGVSFETGGFNALDGWVSSPVDENEGDYSARTTAQDVTLENNIFLKITFTLVHDGYVTFNYRHDNRKYGTRIPPFTELTNLPEVDNYLDIRLDGVLVDGATLVGDGENIPQFEVDNGAGWTAVNGRIDNVNSPENCDAEDEFLQWRPARVWMRAGTHTLSWTQRRKWQDNGHMVSQIDELHFDNLMAGEDTTGKRRWMYNGHRVQKAEWWAWPARDDETHIDVSGRVSTAPDYITLDKQGRILYGNPHYVVRLIPRDDEPTLYKLDPEHGFGRGTGHDETQGAGYVRFTASVAYQRETIGEPAPSCSDPDPEYTYEDLVIDPPWGAFQILPVGEGGDYQVRGANASLRDATEQPFPKENFTYEHPVTGEMKEELFRDRTTVTKSWCWSQRPSGWTITDDGKHLRPHVEVIWRPTRFTTAYPSSP
jgi:hypothetical protein